MNIDFHYGVVYLVARIAGMTPVDAETVAHAGQYVDDSTTTGVLAFEGGETFERLPTAHKMLDDRNFDPKKDNAVWAPFHFLPGNRGDELDDRVVCRPDSPVARRMVAAALATKSTDIGLHRLGIALHVYVDTWAHQGFCGTLSRNNVVTRLDRKSTRLNSSHTDISRMPSSA